MNNRRGIAIITVIVSMAIIAVALTMAVSAFVSATRLTRHAANFTLASNFAEGALERARSQPFDSIRTMSISDLPKLPEVKCDLSVTSLENGLKNLTVTCAWTEGTRPCRVVFSTLVARGGSR